MAQGDTLRRSGIVRLVAVSLLSACASDGPSQLAVPAIDTLPGGVIVVENAAPAGWLDTTGAWRLEEVLRLGGLDGSEGELINPQSVALDAAGRVYVTDQRPAVIKVYHPNGTFLGTIGREGEGPGEFRAGFLAIRGTNLVVHDPRVARTSVFDTSGTYLRSWHSACCVWRHIAIDDADRVVIPAAGSADSIHATFLRYSMAGEVLDTILVPALGEPQRWVLRSKDGVAMTTVPFTPTTAMALAPHGGVVFGWSGRYRLAASETGRDTVRLFGRSWERTPISPARREAVLREMVTGWAKGWGEAAVRDVFQLGDVPDQAPAFDGLSVDGRGFYWVQLDPGDDSTHTRFDVFDRDGIYLGPVQGPAFLGGATWGADHVVTIAEDADGVPMVVVYRIVRRP